VTGTALAYLLSEYTDLESIILIEKYREAAPLNSSSLSNSQTLHFGRIETNLGLKAALAAKRASEMIRLFAVKHRLLGEVIFRGQEMQLAVGEEEIRETERRFKEIAPHYPDLRLLKDGSEVAAAEPLAAEGRRAPLAAVFSDEGYAADFGRLSQSFIERAGRSGKLERVFGTEVAGVRPDDGGYLLSTSAGEVRAEFVVFASGAHSLYFAKMAGAPEAASLSVLPVAGDFYYAQRGGRGLLRGKVYTVQDERLPFAAIHGDPDVAVSGKTRFGPTAKVLPFLERRNPGTALSFVRSAVAPGVAMSLLSLLKDEVRRNFMARNAVYGLPIVGKRAFLREARKIVPTLELGELEFAEGVGGIRPQIVDGARRELVKGEVKLRSRRAIFNMTPSPGATKCLASAAEDMDQIASALGASVRRDEFRSDFPVDGAPVGAAEGAA
jgi:malate dehydrogenase (quinone)